MRILAVLPWSFLGGCDGPLGGEVQVTQSEVISTVFSVSFDFAGDPPDTAWVEVEGPDGVVARRRVPLVGPDPHVLTLVGLEPVTDYVLTPVVERDGRERVGRAEEVTTGQIPAEIPDTLIEEPGGAHFGGYLFTSLPAAPSGPLLLDTRGNVLWWFFPTGISGVSRALLSRHGDAVLFADLNAWGGRQNTVRRVSLDGRVVSKRETPYLHHDFTELPDGTIAYLAYDPREVRGREVLGDRLVELSTTGDREVVFSVWEHIDALPFEPGAVLGGSVASPADSDGFPLDWARCSPKVEPMRWPHANALEYLEVEDAYLISFLCLDVVVRIDRSSGALDWVLGGPFGDFALQGDERDFLELHHNLDWRDDELLVFVNGDLESSPARVEAYRLDLKRGLAESTWEYEPSPALHVPTLGDVHRLHSGNVLVNFGYAGQIHEVTSDGSLVWRLSLGVGGALGYTTVLDTLYPGEKLGD